MSSSAPNTQTVAELVKRHAANITAVAQSVRIDMTALLELNPQEPPPFDTTRHFKGDSVADTADFVLTSNAINFGSGWFPSLKKRPDSSGYWTIAWSLADHFREHGPWTAQQLRELNTAELAAILGQTDGIQLMSLYTQALRSLGTWLGDRRAIDVFNNEGKTADGLARAVIAGMPFYRDTGLYKRAQILVADLESFGIGNPSGLDELTMFADNLVPHVLRCLGVLHYDANLASWIESGRLLEIGGAEHEIRCCAVHAVELLSSHTGVPSRKIDSWLWHLGQDPEFKARPRHRCQTVFY